MAEQQNAAAPNGSINESATTGLSSEDKGIEGKAPASKPIEIYPVVKDVWKSILSLHLERAHALQDVQCAIRKSKTCFGEEQQYLPGIGEKLNHCLRLQQENRKKRAYIMEQIRALSRSTEVATSKISHEKELSSVYDKDARTLCDWFPQTETTLDGYCKEKEQSVSQLKSKKDAINKAVETERRRRQEISEERDRIKNQRQNDMQKSCEDRRTSRRDDLRQKFHLSVSSNQGDGQELSMLEEKLKKVQRENVQRSTEQNATKLKAGQHLISLADSMAEVKIAIDYAEKEKVCENEIREIEQVTNVLIQENNINVEKIQDEIIDKEEKALTEVRLLLPEESLKGRNQKVELERDIYHLENLSRQLDDDEVKELADSKNRQLWEEKVKAQLTKYQEQDVIVTEELNVFDSLIEFTSGKVYENSQKREKKQKELQEIGSLHTTQKVELDEMKTLREGQRDQMFERDRRVEQIEKDIANLQNSIKLMLAENVQTLSNDFEEETKKLADIEGSENCTSQIREVVKLLENEIKQAYGKLTSIFTDTIDKNDELNKLSAATADFEKMSLVYENGRKAMEEKLQMLKKTAEVSNKEEENLSANYGESERLAKSLTDEISDIKTKSGLLQEKLESASTLERVLVEKKSILSQLDERENEEKYFSEEKQRKLDEMQSERKKRLLLLEEHKRNKTQEVKRLEEEFNKDNAKNYVFKAKHEEVLFAYDTIVETHAKMKGQLTTLRRQKIKLLNAGSKEETFASEKDEREKKLVEAARSDRDRLNRKCSEDVQQQSSTINSLKSQLATFRGKIAELEKKRKNERENTMAGLPIEPKPILKSPVAVQETNVLRTKKSVSFGKSSDNLEILPSDSSLDIEKNTKVQKRKLFNPIENADFPSKVPKPALRSSPQAKLLIEDNK